MSAQIHSKGLTMKRIATTILAILLLSTNLALASAWQTGKLTDTEKQEVPSGSMTTYNSDRNSNGNRNGTSHTTNETDTYQVFTIETPTKTFVVREKLNFPWSKPANITLGEEVKFMVSGNKMTILDDDNKQHKASIVKSSVTPTR